MAQINVVVPVYKVEQYLDRCITSILAQTMRDFTLILVDDGSPDNCGVLCDAWAERDHRIHVIHQQNQGLSGARNAGIEWALDNTESEWITFVDSDDWIHPRYLELLLQAAEATGCFAVVAGFRLTELDGDQPDLPEEICPRVVNTERFYCEDKLTATVAWGKLYLREDFREIRYPKSKIHEDELTTHKLLFRYSEIAVIDQPLYQYFQNQQGIMRSGWNPKHIAESEGMHDQLRFFLEKGHHDAAACAAKAYLNSLYRNIMQARLGGERFTSEVDALRKQLRHGLLRYRKLAGVTLRNENWLFYEAFPKETLPYRAWKKLRRHSS